MNPETPTMISPAAVPARCLPAGELNRATDLLLEAVGDTTAQAGAAARAAVAEFADWCVVDLLAGEDELERVASAAAEDLDEDLLGTALSRFAEPDPMMLSRLELARAPIRVEDPVWLPHHRAVAAAVDGGGIRGAIIALIPLEDHDLTGDLWFMGALGRRLAQVRGLSGAADKLGGIVVAEPGGVNGHSRTARLRRAH